MICVLRRCAHTCQKAGLSDHQNLLVRMLGNVTSTQAMMLRLARLWVRIAFPTSGPTKSPR